MPTPPLPESILTKVKARSQSVRWVAVLREVRVFSAHCCDIDSDGIMGVAKQPVVIATISPNPVCLDPVNGVTIDFTGTYVPGNGTIDSKTVDWNEGAGDESVVGDTASNVYASAGEYTVTAKAVSGSLSQSIEIEVNVIDCSDTLLIASIYAATDGSGVYYWE